AMPYGLLTTLRVEARRAAAPRLVAIDAARRRWTLSLQPADLARAQATLDIIDHRLGPGTAPAAAAVLPRLVAIIAVLVSVLGGQIAVALVAWLATLQPASSLLGAAGASAIAAAAVLVAGLAGALAFSRSAAARSAAAALAAAACAALFLGSTAYLTHFVDDPFLARMSSIAFESLTTPPVTEFSVPFMVDRLSLSPDGRYAALVSEDRDERITIHAGPAGGPFTEFEGDEAGFVDETHLLLLEQQKTSSVLRLIDLEHQNRAVWSRPIHLLSRRLSFSRPSQRWQILGWNEAGDLAGVAGRIGDQAVSEQQWETDMDEIAPLTAWNGNVIVEESRLVGGPFPFAGGPSRSA